MDENQIILLAQAGNKEAFTQLVKEHNAFLRSLAAFYVGVQDSHDAAQEIWLAVFRKLWQLEDPEKFLPWLKKLCFYQCLNYRKSRGHKAKELQLSAGDWLTIAEVIAGRDMQIDELMIRKELRRHISQQLDLLPAEYGMILRLRYMRELNLNQISELIQLPVTTVKGRLFQGRRLLKARLSQIVNRKGNCYDQYGY